MVAATSKISGVALTGDTEVAITLDPRYRWKLTHTGAGADGTDDADSAKSAWLSTLSATISATKAVEDCKYELTDGASETLGPGISKLYIISAADADAVLKVVRIGMPAKSHYGRPTDVQTEIDTNVLASDSFNRDDGSALGVTDGLGHTSSGGANKAWTETYGSFEIASNHLAGSGGDEPGAVACVDVSQSDHHVGCDMPTSYNIGNGVVARVVDANNLWVAIVSGDYLRVYLRTTAGGWVMKAEAVVTHVEPYTCELIASGNDIYATYSGVTTETVTDATHNTATKAGVRCASFSSSDHDNFWVLKT